MVITNKQISLVKDLHKQYMTNTGETLSIEDYLMRITNLKGFDELTHKDVNKLVEDCNKHCKVSDDQNHYLDNILQLLCETLGKTREECQLELVEKCEIEDMKSLTKFQFSRVLSYVESSYDVFLPNRVNWSNYRYNALEQTDEYIIGDQLNFSRHRVMKIISFKRLLVLDWDNTDLQTVLQILRTVPYKFSVYQTYNGYHAYCTSHFFPHDDLKTLQVMKKLQCDIVYITFTYYTGFVVRLTPKPGREEAYVEKYLQDVNEQYKDISCLRDGLSKKDSMLETIC
jgi:hypothetical protein